MHTEYTDQQLVQLLNENSEQAVELLFRKYYSFLCRSAFRILPDESIVEDLVQEVFYELWRRRGQLQINVSLKAYLRRSIMNRALNYLRDNRKVFSEEEEKAASLPDNLPEPGQQLEAAQLQELIDRVIDGLPERCRIVFVLSRFEEMSYQEIAEELGISAKTVEHQISKALRLLRDALGPLLTIAMLFCGTHWF